MGVDVTSWRIRIGQFNASGPMASVRPEMHKPYVFLVRRTTARELYDICVCILTLVSFLVLLLVINGNVELNPGPRRHDLNPSARHQEPLRQPFGLGSPGMDQVPERPPRGPPKMLVPITQPSPQLHQKVQLPKRSPSSNTERRYVPDPTTGLSPRRHPSTLRQSRGPPPDPLQNAFTRVDQLNKLVVPLDMLERLSTADYCFEMPYDFSLKKGNAEYNNQMTSISCIICGLLNGAGGYLFIKGKNHPEANKHKCVDEWQNKVRDHLELFVPKNLFVHSVIFHKFSQGYDIVVHVKMSPTLVTYRSNLHWRNGTSSLDLREHSEIALALKSKSGEKLPSLEHVDKSHKYHYDQAFDGDETREREFKFYDTTDFTQLWNKMLQDKVKSGQLSTFERTLFAFANMKNGGEILLGVRDDGKVLGQVLSSSERRTLRQNIAELMIKNTEGKKRIWGSSDYVPVENNDWFVRFHVVTGRNCPNTSEDRFVVQIYMPPFRHCVFSAEPECYSLEYNGYLRVVAFEEWMKLMSATTQTVNLVFTEDHTFQIDKLDGSSDKTQQFRSSYDDATIKALAKELHDYEKLDYAGSESKTLMWTRDSDVWSKSHKNELRSKHSRSGTTCHELLNPQQPMNILPSREILDSCLVPSAQKMSTVWDFISKNYAMKTTIIGCSDLCSVFPELKRLKTPQSHVADLFLMSENSDLAVFTICSNTSIWHHEQREYVLNAVRMMKKSILSCMFKHGLTPTSTVTVVGYLWDLDSEIVKMREPKQDGYRERYPLQKLQLALDEMICRGDKYLKTRLDEEITIELTKNQMKQLLVGYLSKVTVCRGPPGSGKTVMSLYICDNNLQLKTHTRKQMMYLCPTKPLSRTIEYQDKCRVQTVKTGLELFRAIESGFKEGVRCFIVDDIQYISCEPTHWLDIFDIIDTPDAKAQLYLFLDSTYQNMLSYESETTIINALDQYRKHHRYFSYAVPPPLCEILRNTRVVASFFMANVKDVKAKQDLKCNHDWTGDEVTVQTCGDLLTATDNPVMVLAREIINARSWAYKHMYTPKDTVVLVDADGQGNAKKIVKQLISVFKKHSEFKAHTAETVPVEGIVIDEVKNFVGLEAKAVIIVLADQFDRLQHFQKDTYLSFLSSRGIMRVAFLLQNLKLPDVIKHMNFSEEDIWVKRSYELLTRMKQLATPQEELEAQHLIERNVPKTPHWKHQVDLLSVSRKLRSVFSTGSSKEVDIYIVKNFLPVQHDCCRAMWLDDLKSQLKKLDVQKNDLEAWCTRKVPVHFMNEIKTFYWSLVKPKIVSYANQEQPEDLNRWISRYVPKSWLSGENVIPVFSTLFCDNILKSEPTKGIRMIAEVIQEQCVESSNVDIQVKLLEQLCERLQPDSIDLLLYPFVDILLKTELVGVIAFDTWYRSSNITNNNKTAEHWNSRDATKSLHQKLCSVENILKLCHHKITNKYHPEKLTCWFEQNVSEHLHQNPQYVSAITATIVKSALQGQKVDLVQLYFSFVSEYLRTPPKIQRVVLQTVYKTAMEQGRLNELLIIVNVLCQYNFVDVEVLRDWVDSLGDSELAPEISTLYEDYHNKRALTTREQILTSVSGSGSEGAEWLKPDHAFYWHDMSHYQSLVLATICEIIIQSPGDRKRILHKCNEFYLPAVNNKVGLLYSLQCIMYYKDYATELIYELWTLMLCGSNASDKGHFSKEVFLEWSCSKYPLRSEGREPALEAFKLFSTTSVWMNKQ